MDLPVYLRRTQRPLPEIRARTREIYDAVLKQSPWIKDGNFAALHSRDLEFLFAAYDKTFFEGTLNSSLTGLRAPLTFRVSKRMTRVGGTTTRFRPRFGFSNKTTFEIAVSSTLLFATFYDVNRPIRVTGIECRDRLEALQRVFEHELIHLTEMMVFDDSSCSQRRFQQLAFQFFAHTEATHQLITPGERAVSKYGIRPGDKVRFRVEGTEYIGFVNRVTKRATVLVEDPNSPLYSDGRRYAKFYVPLAMLEPTG